MDLCFNAIRLCLFPKRGLSIRCDNAVVITQCLSGKDLVVFFLHRSKCVCLCGPSQKK